jgi:error-prone DNA polymerase
LRYEYPAELVPQEHTASSYLRHLTEEGLRQRYPHGTPAHVRTIVEKELVLIAELPIT